MAGVPAGLPAGVRLSDHISLGVIARAVPPERVRQVLAETGRASERERDLPAPVMVYYAIALALYMGSSTREVLRCLLEGLRWLWGAEAVKVAGKSGISQARSRLGRGAAAPALRGLVQPIATRASKGAWYRDWRLVSLDGSCLDVADTEANRAEFGCRGPAAAGAPSRSCASRRWWRTARTCCSAPAGPLRGWARRRWPVRCWRRCGPACCAWPTGSSSGTRSGSSCSTRSKNGLALQGCADGAVCVDAAPCGGADDGAEGGVEIGTPCGSEAAGDLAIGGVGRSSRSLPLLSAVTSGWSRKVKRCSRSLP
jgi:hypothetical protein